MRDNQFKKILGIKTKGGFPTIEVTTLKELQDLESQYKFYDHRLDTYYVFNDGFFFSFCNGNQKTLTESQEREVLIEKGMKLMHKAIFPNSKLSVEEEIARARKMAGLPPKKPRDDR